jgi:dihydrofolate reductase
MRVHVIAALCKNRGIGFQGKIPWHCRKDMKYFKKITTGKGKNAVIMGRKTWDSIQMPLQNRENIVITRDSKSLHKNVVTYNSVVNALHYCRLLGIDTTWIIGGQQIYEQATLLKPDAYFFTFLHKDYECDTFMPKVPEEYTLQECKYDTYREPGDKEDTTMSFNIYSKNNPK